MHGYATWFYDDFCAGFMLQTSSCGTPPQKNVFLLHLEVVKALKLAIWPNAMVSRYCGNSLVEEKGELFAQSEMPYKFIDPNPYSEYYWTIFDWATRNHIKPWNMFCVFYFLSLLVSFCHLWSCRPCKTWALHCCIGMANKLQGSRNHFRLKMTAIFDRQEKRNCAHVTDWPARNGKERMHSSWPSSYAVSISYPLLI